MLAALAFTENALACQICVPRPTQTLADELLQSDKVVLAREDPERPYHYVAVETLKGDPGTAAIDLFMNTPVRRQLAANPELTMLLARDSRNREWRTLGIAHDDFEHVARRILNFEGGWIPNETNNLERLRELAPLLGHEDLRLHELAYLEIGRAPYGSIKAVSTDVSLDRVRAMLSDLRYIEWRGLDILLLGLSDVEEDRVRVIEEMENRQRHSFTQNLDAWATAYLEVTGTAGIDRLSHWYFRNAAKSRGELRSIIRALSVHATNAPEYREPVVAAYRKFLDVHPDAAPDIARDLIAWREWEFSEKFRELRPEISERDPLGAYTVNLYLRRAAAHTRRVTD
jgi:hypothetical protein